MTIEGRVKQFLEGLDLVDPKVTIFESHGSRILAAVISPSFEQMTDGDRQSWIWGKLIDDLGDFDSREVGYVITATPGEVAEMLAPTDATAPNL